MGKPIILYNVAKIYTNMVVSPDLGVSFQTGEDGGLAQAPLLRLSGGLEFGFNLTLIWMMAWAALGVIASLMLKRYTEEHGLAGQKA